MAEAAETARPAQSGECERGAMDSLGITLVLGNCLIVGLHQVAIKVSISGLTPLFAAGARSVIAALLVLAWCYWRRIPLFERDGTFWVGVLAGVLFGLDFAFMYVGLDYTTASRSVIFLYTMPIFVALGAHFLNAGEKMSRAKWLGIGLAFFGIVIAFYDGLAAMSPSILFGDALAMLAGLSWAATTIVIRKTDLRRISAEKLLFYQLWVSALVLLPLSLAFGEEGIVEITPLVLGSFFYQTVIIAFAAYVVWFWLLRLYPPAQLSTFTLLTPIVGVLGGVVLLGEPVRAVFIAGALLTIVGLVVVTRAGQAENRSAP